MCFEVERIQQLCRERDWTPYRLAQEMKLTPSNVYNLLSRPSTPSVYTLRKVCTALGISMEQFYHTEESTCIADPQQAAILKKYLMLSREKRGMVESFMEGLDKSKE